MAASFQSEVTTYTETNKIMISVICPFRYITQSANQMPLFLSGCFCSFTCFHGLQVRFVIICARTLNIVFCVCKFVSINFFAIIINLHKMYDQTEQLPEKDRRFAKQNYCVTAKCFGHDYRLSYASQSDPKLTLLMK